MYIDIFLAVFILIGIIQGFHRGVIRTLFAILGILIGFLAALKFAPYVVTFFERVVKLSPSVALILGLVLTFLVLLLGIRWLGRSFENTLKLVKLNIFNKILGAILFSILMIITYSAIIWFVGRINLISEAEKAKSKSYPLLQEIPAKTGVLIEKIKPVFKEIWDKMDSVVKPEKEDGDE
ncbi:MAG TPA: CvpA family protein [Saprospiraceae bacterium]|nr:CvpA family protein [Saprospiraceae bacterium]